MKKDSALLVAGLVFTLVAVGHLLRMYFGTEIVVSGYVVPQNLSIVGLVIGLVLAVWMFMARKSGR